MRQRAWSVTETHGLGGARTWATAAVSSRHARNAPAAPTRAAIPPQSAPSCAGPAPPPPKQPADAYSGKPFRIPAHDEPLLPELDVKCKAPGALHTSQPDVPRRPPNETLSRPAPRPGALPEPRRRDALCSTRARATGGGPGGGAGGCAAAQAIGTFFGFGRAARRQATTGTAATTGPYGSVRLLARPVGGGSGPPHVGGCGIPGRPRPGGGGGGGDERR